MSTKEEVFKQLVEINHSAEIDTVKKLIAVAREAQRLLEDSQQNATTGEITVPTEAYKNLNEAIDKLSELPDDKPGYTMSPAGKAEWLLRDFIELVTT